MKTLVTIFLLALFCVPVKAQVSKPFMAKAEGTERWRTTLIGVSVNSGREHTEDQETEFMENCQDSFTHTNPQADEFTEIFISGQNDLIQDTMRISIFPNPGKGAITITCDKATTFILVNILGEIIQKIELNDNNNNTCVLNDLTGGVYFLRDNAGRVRQKIIITK